MILWNCSRTLVSLSLLLVTLTSSLGCRSTSRWNPSTWFASREPDASMIAGRSGGSELPTSPAISQTPTALANNYGVTGGGYKGGMQSGLAGGASATTPSYGSQSDSATIPPSAGLAARSNGFSTGSTQTAGYQTGPYGMSPNASSTNLSTPAVAASTSNSNGPANANPTNPTSFPSPYGGSYGTTTAQGPMGTSSALATTSVPTAAGLPDVPTGGSATWNVPEYPSLPAMQVSAPLGSSPGSSGVPMNPTTSVPMNANVPASSAYQSAPASGSYSPGTTGRSTNYNFGSGTSYQGSAPTSPSSSSSLPPNTATGNSQWVR